MEPHKLFIFSWRVLLKSIFIIQLNQYSHFSQPFQLLSQYLMTWNLSFNETQVIVLMISYSIITKVSKVKVHCWKQKLLLIWMARDDFRYLQNYWKFWKSSKREGKVQNSECVCMYIHIVQFCMFITLSMYFLSDCPLFICSGYILK